MGWLFAAVLFFLFGFIPVGAGFHFRDSRLQVYVIAGVLHVNVFSNTPGEQKKAAKGEKSRIAKKENEKPAVVSGPQPDERNFLDYVPLVRIALKCLCRLTRKITIQNLSADILLPADDPCDMAIYYGRLQAAAEGLRTVLENHMNVRRIDVCISGDIFSEATQVHAAAAATIRLGDLLRILMVYALYLVIAYLRIRNNKKAVYPNESKAS